MMTWMIEMMAILVITYFNAKVQKLVAKLTLHFFCANSELGDARYIFLHINIQSLILQIRVIFFKLKV